MLVWNAMLFRRLKYISMFFVLFFMMFPPQILIGSFILKTMQLSLGLPSIIGFYLFIRKGRLEKSICYILLLMTIAFLYLAVVSMIGGFQDTTILKAILLGYIMLFASYSVVYIFRRLYGSDFVKMLLLNIFMAGVLHSAIMILTFLSPIFSEFLYQYIVISEKSEESLNLNIRVPGIVFSGFSFLSTSNAMITIIGIVSLFEISNKFCFYRTTFFVLGIITTLIGIFLSGRTGQVILVLGVVFYFIWNFYRQGLLQKIMWKKIATFAFLMSLLFFSVIYYFDLYLYTDNLMLTFEMFYNFSETGRLSTKTTDALLEEHYFFPSSLSGLLFGSSNFGRSEYLPYIPSDVGYVLFVQGAGICGFILSYSFYLLIIFYAYKLKHKDPILSFLIIYFVFVIFIANFKDFYFISFSGYSQIIFLLLCALLINSGMNSRYEKFTIQM